MASRNSYHHRGDRTADATFKKYRDVAPESVDDSTLRQLIASNEHNHDSIAAAIDRLWADHANQPVWTTHSKKDKKANTDASPKAPGPHRDSGRDRHGKEGKFSGGKPKSNALSSSAGASVTAAKTEQIKAPEPVAAPSPAVAETAPPAKAPASKNIATPSPVPAPVAPSSSAPKTAWGSGNLADKLKKKEEADRLAALAPPPAPAPVDVPVSTEAPVEEPKATPVAEVASRPKSRRSRGKGDRKAQDNATSATVSTPAHAVDVEVVVGTEPEPVAVAASSEPEPVKSSVVPEVVAREPSPAPTTVAEPVNIPAPVTTAPVQNSSAETSIDAGTKTFLKLPGKWDTPVEQTESSFQFGSFGSFNSESESAPAPPAVAPATVAAPTVESEPESRVPIESNWGATNGSVVGLNFAPASSLNYFPASKGLPSVTNGPGAVSDASRFDAGKPAAPPGLDAQTHSKGQVGSGVRAPNTQPQHNRNKGDASQMMPHSHPQAYYPGPPGMSGSQGRMYPFDAQAPFMPPIQPFGGPVPSVVGAPSVPQVPTSSSSTGGAPQSQQQQQQVPQGQQPAFSGPPGMPPFYGYPQSYYPYYYSQQAAPYYNPGRDMYPRPYGQQYPGYDFYQGNQFADAQGSYGNVPMHGAMGIAGQQPPNIAPGAGGVGGAGGNKTAKGSSSVGGPAGSSGGVQDGPGAQHGYGGYPSYPPRSSDQWQYQNWGAGMMPFPASAASGQPAPGFPQQPAGGLGGHPQQQSQQQQQQQQQPGGQRASNTGAYGGAPFQGRNGPAGSW